MFDGMAERSLTWLPICAQKLQPTSSNRSCYNGGITSKKRLCLLLFVRPLLPLPPPPPRPASIYGHLPFGTKTAGDTAIDRREATPTRRRSRRPPTGGTIDRDTYGAPAPESPLAPTGGSVLHRVGLHVSSLGQCRLASSGAGRFHSMDRHVAVLRGGGSRVQRLKVPRGPVSLPVM